MRKQIYLYTYDKNLPAKGWIQRCNICECYTSRIIIYKLDQDYEYLAHLCNTCKRKKYQETERFKIICNRKIIKYFD